MDYNYPDDGKLHLRYSDLPRCTIGQIDRLIAEHKDPSLRFESDHMKWGTDRHEMWSNEILRTGVIPECFREIEDGRYNVAVSHVEEEFASEIAPGVVMHSRPDAISVIEEAVIDFKTVVDGTNGFESNLHKYKTSKQGLFYAFQMALHDIRIKRVIYLCEIWNGERTKILCYRAVVQNVNLMDIANMKYWAIDRVALYKASVQRLERAAINA